MQQFEGVIFTILSTYAFKHMTYPATDVGITITIIAASIIRRIIPLTEYTRIFMTKFTTSTLIY